MFKRQEQRLAMLQNIQATSKTSLKLQCLQLSQGDVKQAKELYDFLATDVNLPDFEPVKPSFLESTKDTADGILQWIRENKDTLAEGYNFIKGIIPKKTPSAPLPNIN